MAYHAPALPAPSLNAGLTLKQALTFFSENAVGLSTLTLLATLLPAALESGAPDNLAVQIVALVLSVPATAIVYAAAVLAVERGRTGTPTPGKRLDELVRPAWPLLLVTSGLYAVSVVAIFVGLIGFVVGAFIVAIVISVAGPVLILEQRGIVASLKRSHELTAGHWGQIFVIGLGIVGVVIGAYVAMAMLGSIIGADPWLTDYLTQGWTMALTPVTMTFLYYRLLELRGEATWSSAASSWPLPATSAATTPAWHHQQPHVAAGPPPAFFEHVSGTWQLPAWFDYASGQWHPPAWWNAYAMRWDYAWWDPELAAWSWHPQGGAPPKHL